MCGGDLNVTISLKLRYLIVKIELFMVILNGKSDHRLAIVLLFCSISTDKRKGSSLIKVPLMVILTRSIPSASSRGEPAIIFPNLHYCLVRALRQLASSHRKAFMSKLNCINRHFISVRVIIIYCNFTHKCAL